MEIPCIDIIYYGMEVQMSKNKHYVPDGREILKLTKWELKNLHLPPVTTITL